MIEPILSPCRAGLVIALLAAGACTDAVGAPLTLFRTEGQALQYCSNDSVVWLDLSKRTYYTQGQRLYARGNKGTFVCRKAARESGYRRSVLGRR